MLSTTSPSNSTPVATSKQVAATHVVFLILAAVVYFGVAKCEFASIQTMAGMSQCLAMVLLAMQVLGRQNMEGVSFGSLGLHALAFAFRLSSTTWLNGYLPVDASGDWLYQAFDVISLLLALRMMVHLTVQASQVGRKSQLREAYDVVGVLCVALVLGALFHANMDKRPLFDTFWMASVFLASAAMLAQLSALRTPAEVVSSASKHCGPLAGNALAAMAISQVLSGIYMWHARNDMTLNEWIEGFNHASWAVLAAHAVPLILTCDFSQDMHMET